jgi:hypothetical protein
MRIVPVTCPPAGLPACWLSGLLACLCVLCPAAFNAAAAEPSAALEYKVKAGYLFNFAKFVEWPASAFPATNSPFVIAVLDGGEASPVVEQVLGVKEIDGHRVQVRAVSATSLPRNAHILLVTRAAGKTPEEIRDALNGAATLVVGETEEFAERGGVFGFVRDNENVRLTLCLEHAARAGLKVSAKLSSIARPVKSKKSK